MHRKYVVNFFTCKYLYKIQTYFGNNHLLTSYLLINHQLWKWAFTEQINNFIVISMTTNEFVSNKWLWANILVIYFICKLKQKKSSNEIELIEKKVHANMVNLDFLEMKIFPFLDRFVEKFKQKINIQLLCT